MEAVGDDEGVAVKVEVPVGNLAGSGQELEAVGGNAAGRGGNIFGLLRRAGVGGDGQDAVSGEDDVAARFDDAWQRSRLVSEYRALGL